MGVNNCIYETYGESPREGIIIERRGDGGLRKRQNEYI